jgi:hypothetical protein
LLYTLQQRCNAAIGSGFIDDAHDGLRVAAIKRALCLHIAAELRARKCETDCKGTLYGVTSATGARYFLLKVLLMRS